MTSTIRTVGVCGAGGTMGAGIAIVAARAGFGSDEGLATRSDMDLTCRLGLGYRDGPIERLVRGGLADNYAISKALIETYGTPGYAPARRSLVAAQREGRNR